VFAVFTAPKVASKTSKEKLISISKACGRWINADIKLERLEVERLKIQDRS
jgi:hypothetical protein